MELFSCGKCHVAPPPLTLVLCTSTQKSVPIIDNGAYSGEVRIAACANLAEGFSCTSEHTCLKHYLNHMEKTGGMMYNPVGPLTKQVLNGRGSKVAAVHLCESLMGVPLFS